MKSIKGSILNQTIFKYKLYPISYDESVQTIKDLQKSGKVLTIASSITVLTSGAFLMNPTLIFDFLNLVEMFSYSILFDLNFHKNFIKFIVSLKNSLKLPSIEISIKTKDSEIPKKFYNYGIDSSFLILNSAYLLILIASLLILTGFTLLGARSNSEFISHFCIRLKKIIFFGWFHRICLQGCFDLSVFSLLSLNYTNLDSVISIFDLICCYFIFVI